MARARCADDRLPNIVLFGQLSRAKRKAGHPRLEREGVIKKDLTDMGTSSEGVKRDAVNRLGWPQAAWCCGKLLVVVARKQV